MDDAVLNAMQRWPDVPAVHGWLSLDARGRWKLHPNGGGNATPPEPGEPITSPPFIAFINRNYSSDEQGRWFFQNGPQRVYVQHEAAPYILRLGDDGVTLQTHTGQAVTQVDEWLLEDGNRLYARLPAGLGLIEDRDLPPVLAGLHTDTGPLLEALESGAEQGLLSYPDLPTAPWRSINALERQAMSGPADGKTAI